jgi:hypothetical protein
MNLQKLGINTDPVELNEWLSGEDPDTHRIPRGYWEMCNGSLWPGPGIIVDFAKDVYQVDLEWKSPVNAAEVISGQGFPVIMWGVSGDEKHFSLAVDSIVINGLETLGINDPYHSHVCRVVAENPASPVPNTKLSCPLQPGRLGHVTTKAELDEYSYYSVPLGYFQRRNGDRTPSLQFFARDAEIRVANSQGLRTGFDSTTGQYVAEIPNSLYYDPSIVPPGDEPSGIFVRTLYLPNEADGSYTLTVTDGTAYFVGALADRSQATAFSIDIVGYDELLNSVESTIVRAFEPGLTIQYQVVFEDGQDIQITDTSYRSLYLPLIVR